MLISYCHWTLHCFAASGGSFGPLPGRQIQPFSVIQGAKKTKWIFSWIFFSGPSKNPGKTRVFEWYAVVLQNRHSPIQIRSSPSRVLSLSVTGLFFCGGALLAGDGSRFRTLSFAFRRDCPRFRVTDAWAAFVSRLPLPRAGKQMIENATFLQKKCYCIL